MKRSYFHRGKQHHTDGVARTCRNTSSVATPPHAVMTPSYCHRGKQHHTDGASRTLLQNIALSPLNPRPTAWIPDTRMCGVIPLACHFLIMATMSATTGRAGSPVDSHIVLVGSAGGGELVPHRLTALQLPKSNVKEAVSAIPQRAQAVVRAKGKCIPHN